MRLLFAMRFLGSVERAIENLKPPLEYDSSLSDVGSERCADFLDVFRVRRLAVEIHLPNWTLI